MGNCRQARLEQDAEVWRDFQQSLDKVRATLSRAQFTDEPVNNLAGVHFNIQKINHAHTDTEVRMYKYAFCVVKQSGVKIFHESLVNYSIYPPLTQSPSFSLALQLIPIWDHTNCSKRVMSSICCPTFFLIDMWKRPHKKVFCKSLQKKIPAYMKNIMILFCLYYLHIIYLLYNKHLSWIFKNTVGRR